MAIVKSWKSYGFGSEYLTTAKALKCVDIMRKTAVQHSLELTPSTAAALKYKVNNTDPPSFVDLPAGPFSGEYNWMRVSIGSDAGDNEIAVIIYHLLRHRLVDATTNAYWSASAGFLLNLVPNAPNAAGAAIDPIYTELAIDFATQLHADLKTFKPLGTFSVIYDHVDKTEAAADPPGEKEANRRSTKVGEFGWAFQQDATIQKQFKISKPVRVKRPVDRFGVEIPGWGRDVGLNGTHDSDIVVTMLEAL